MDRIDLDELAEMVPGLDHEELAALQTVLASDELWKRLDATTFPHIWPMVDDFPLGNLRQWITAIRSHPFARTIAQGQIGAAVELPLDGDGVAAVLEWAAELARSGFLDSKAQLADEWLVRADDSGMDRADIVEVVGIEDQQATRLQRRKPRRELLKQRISKARSRLK